MDIPDRWNPRVWLRDPLVLIARWLIRPTRNEALQSRIDFAKQLMRSFPHATVDIVASALDMDPKVLTQALAEEDA